VDPETRNSPPERAVLRVESPAIECGCTPAHLQRHFIRGTDWAASDPFLLMAEDWAGPGVFDHHPQRGFQTFIYVLEGTVEHCDNHGNCGVIGPGDALLMTAGRGAVCSEFPADGKTIHLLQLWINLPRTHKLVPARCQQLPAARLPVRHEHGAEFRVFTGALANEATPLSIIEITLEPGARITQDVPAGFNAFAAGLNGDGQVASSETRAGQIAWLAPLEAPGVVALASGDQGMRALLFAARPLQEPVAAGGAFVMNTREEVCAAFAEYRAQRNRFGL
jgi:redox-sensitive bicupin YhaK (pirin superfamily)